jgi:hypothetical protein
MLKRTRHSLGMHEDLAFDMHIAAFNDEEWSLLGLNTASTNTNDDDDDENDDDESETGSNSRSSPDPTGIKFSEGTIERVRTFCIGC